MALKTGAGLMARAQKLHDDARNNISFAAKPWAQVVAFAVVVIAVTIILLISNILIAGR